jgi:YbbR domain-containing protein
MDWIRRNFSLKLTAFITAVVLWFTFNYLSAGPAYNKTLDVPLSLHNVGAGLVAGSNVHKVTIEVTGPRSQLERLPPEAFNAYVDCAGKREGTAALNVAVAGPDAAKIGTVTPSTAVVVLDRYAYRRVPVIATPPDLTSTATEVDPKTVIVAGGQTTLSKVVGARVIVEQATGAQRVVVTLKPVPVDASRTPLAGLTVAPATVRVVIINRKAHA